MDALRARIAGRMLAPGARVPSIRAFAREQGVSTSTVVEAYERLVAEGVIDARPGSGFYVAGRPQPLILGAVAPVPEREIDPLWVMRQTLDGNGTAPKPGCGWLPQGWMPVEAIRRGLRGASRSPEAALVEYGTPLGFPALRAQLSRRLGDRGVEASPDQILLTDSGTQALDLVCRLLLQPGDAVLVDDPCYFNFLGLARAHRARVVGVPMTPAGPDLDAFARVAAEHRPRLYLTTAALHNPTGVSYGPSVAHRLLTLAAAQDIVIVEDDIFADIEPDPAGPRLAAFDGLSRAVQVGSFSKTLSASVRCGYVAARPDWIQSLADLKLATAFGSNDLSARLVHGLLTDGSYRRHVEGLRVKLARAMGDAARHLAGIGLQPWTMPKGGLFLWVELPEGLDAAAVARRAMAQGIVLAPGNVFSVGRTADRHMRVNVAQCGSPRVFEVIRDALAG